jgi:hypothetical protein
MNETPTTTTTEPGMTSNVLPPQKTESKAPIAIGRAGLQLQSLDDLWRFSTFVSKSGLAPKGIQTQEAIFVAVQMGLEVGLSPMAALQNIAVINGRPSIWGDAQLAVVRATGELELFEEWFEQKGQRLSRNPATYTDDTQAVVRIKRRGYEPSEVGFSVADAKKADLWDKPGPWKQYPFRMLKFRARSFALRDAFGDALKGLRSVEEAQDDPVEAAKPATPAGDAPKFTRKAKQSQEPTPASEIVIAQEGSQSTEQAPSTVNDPTQSLSPLQADFAQLCADSGVDFDDAMGWLKTTGRWPGSDAAESFGDVPETVVKALASSPNDIARLVKLFGKVVAK